MKKQLPHFKTSEEAARFWDSHSVTDYLHEFKDVDDVFVLSPALAHKIRERAKKRLVSIRSPVKTFPHKGGREPA